MTADGKAFAEGPCASCEAGVIQARVLECY